MLLAFATAALGVVGWYLGEAQPGEIPCTIPRIPLSSVTPESFRRLYGDKAVILVGTDNEGFVNLTAPATLRHSDLAELPVVLSESSTYSKAKRTMRLGDYLDYVKSTVITLDEDAKSSFLLFGDHPRAGPWEDLLLKHYNAPSVGDGLPMLSFGAAPHYSGVPYHFHGPGFSEVIHGKKRWFVYPPGVVPPHFDPGMTSLQYVSNIYPLLSPEERPLECVIGPGEALYFPDRAYHMTLNYGLGIFVSTFLDQRAVAQAEELPLGPFARAAVY